MHNIERPLVNWARLCNYNETVVGIHICSDAIAQRPEMNGLRMNAHHWNQSADCKYRDSYQMHDIFEHFA